MFRVRGPGNKLFAGEISTSILGCGVWDIWSSNRRIYSFLLFIGFEDSKRRKNFHIIRDYEYKFKYFGLGKKYTILYTTYYFTLLQYYDCVFLNFQFQLVPVRTFCSTGTFHWNKKLDNKKLDISRLQ